MGEAIQSALDQAWPELEVIVVDDGSTDNTPEVVKSFTDPRVVYIRKVNAGLPAARNTGIQNARFDYIGFLDADDIWQPNFIARCMEQFETLTPDFALIACRHAPVDENGVRIQKVYRGRTTREVTSRDLLIRSRFNPSSVIAKRSALQAAGLFDESLTSSEDRDMWIRISASARLFLINEELSCIRYHSTSMSKNAPRMKMNVRRVLEKSRAAGIVPKSDWRFWKKAYAFHLHETSWMYHDAGRSLEAASYAIQSILTYPIFLHPSEEHVVILFRIRALRTFLTAGLLGLFRPSREMKPA